MANVFTLRSAKQFATKLSCRIQKSGKLGFGEKEHDLMNLTDGVYISIASNDENLPMTHLIIKREKDEDSFELRKGNTKYPFVETKLLFDFYHIDYVSQNVYYDLIREQEFDAELHGEVYRANIRINKNTNTTNEEQSGDAPSTD